MDQAELTGGPYLREADVAARFGLSVGTLQNRRIAGRPLLPFLRIGRAIRYRPADVEAFEQGARVEPKGAA